MLKSGVFYFVILAVFLEKALALNEEEKDKIKIKFMTVGATCALEHPIPFEEFATFKSGELPKNGNAGCFTACMFKNLDLFDSKGTWSYENGLKAAKTIFGDKEDLEKVKDFLKSCEKVNEEEVSDGEKGCERAKLAYKCFVQNFDKLELTF